VTIIRKAAKKFDDVKVFYDYFQLKQRNKPSRLSWRSKARKNTKRNMVKLFKIK
jgi:hypothetical protein